MLITDRGVMIRFDVNNVSTTGRATLGVHVIKTDENSKVATMAIVDEAPVDDENQTQTPATEAAETESVTVEESSEE